MTDQYNYIVVMNLIVKYYILIKMKASAEIINWLQDGPAFIKYRTLLDLLDKPEDDLEVKKAYKEMLADPLVQQLITDVNDWENQYVIKRHNDAIHPLHKLVFASSIGIKKKELKPAIDSILSHQSPEGPFQIKIVIPKAFGGDDIPKWDWVATDAPLVLYSLLKLGIANKAVLKGVDYIRDKIEDNGYRCFASASMGKFNGPGRKADCCPYANLIILRMLSEHPEYNDTEYSKTAINTLLHHWEIRGEKKYRMFGIGTDFAKPKVPRIWYDIIHYSDALSCFPYALNNKSFKEIIKLLESQADSEGKFTSKSIWTKWKGWEFCQKKEPSRWLTFLSYRIFKRFG